jgi:hypothetical protein
MSIPRLRAALNGQVIAPGDAAHDQARTVFFGGIDRRSRLRALHLDPKRHVAWARQA